ncbi:MAG: glycosyltransferase [Opitutaceae bacterium]
MQVTHHIESARWLSQKDDAIELAGWCFRPERNLDAVSASVGGVEIAVVSLRERPDVRDYHGGNVHALCSGFEIRLPLLELEAVVELRALAGASTSAPFFSVRAGDLPDRGAIMTRYAEWAKAHRSADAQMAAPVLTASSSNNSTPVVSLLLPVCNTPPRFLSECIDSVLQQIYPHWELRIVNDGSTREGLSELLATFAKRDARISVETFPSNRGISHATNRALAQAQGEFVGFIDHDDRLHPHALAEVVRRLAATNAVAAYTDEEKITVEGELHSGIFKPAFSPELLCGVMYIGHFLCVRTSVARAIGGLNPAYDGIQDFEFALRLSERSRNIEHIPKVLYQWRMSPSSSAASGNVKGDMDRLQLEAVTQHLQRTKRSANLASLGGHRLQLVPVSTESSRRSAIIVRDESFLGEGLAGSGHKIIALKDATVATLIRLLQDTPDERLVWFNEPLRVDSPSTIDALHGFLDEPSVGAVAPVILADDGKVFASGAIITADGKIVPAMRGFSERSDGYNGSLVCNREVSALLASCFAARTKDLLEVMSETAHPFSDAGMAGLCVAWQRRGLRVVACGGLRVRTQRTWAHRRTLDRFEETWTDPYYNPHLDAEHGDYRLKELGSTS